MRIPLADVGRRGRLELAFSLQNGQTILRHSYCEVPFKVTRLLSSGDPAAHLMLMHCTAGIFGGDDLECSIRVERGAAVRITQQSATKIHPSEGRTAKQNNRIVVEPDAQLEFYLEPAIPFAESSLKQTTRIDVQPGGCLMFWEAVMAGRVGRGERWQFREYASETRLYSGDTLLFLDRLQLPKGFEGSPWAMSNCDYVGTGLYAGPCANDFAAALHEKMPEAGIDNPAKDLAVVRVVSVSGPDFHRRREMFTARSR
ncbi:MAG TPA: urease accessory protein UreD [Terriglobia bacterium]|jgi:urease accessory protein UreH